MKDENNRRLPLAVSKAEVYAYVLGYYADNEYMPTRQEIADHFSKVEEKTYSRQWADWVLKELEKDKKISINTRKKRGITLRSPRKK